MLRKYYDIAYAVQLVNIMINKWFNGLLYLHRQATGMILIYSENDFLPQEKCRLPGDTHPTK